MRRERLVPKYFEENRGRILIACAMATLCLFQAALAQSGRNQNKKRTPPPAAEPERKAEPEANPAADKPAPAASVIVGGDRFGHSYSMLPGYVDQAVDSCVARLRKSPALAVARGGNMTRKEAIDLAKKQKDSRVLWLEVRVEMDGPRAASRELSIGYSLFEPQTAKVSAFGQVYLGDSRVGNDTVGVGVPSVTGRLPVEYQLREGGRRVAERVMGKLHTGSRGMAER